MNFGFLRRRSPASVARERLQVLLAHERSFRGKADLGHVIAAAREARGSDPDGYRAEFVRLAEAVRGIGLARRDGAH